MSYSSIPLSFCLLFSSVSVVSAGSGAGTQVSVDLSARRYLGDVSTLERNKFFNIHTHPAYGVMEGEDLEYLTVDLGVGFGRTFNGPFWYYPGKDSLTEPFPTAAQAASLSRAVTDLHETQVTYKYRDQRIVITDHPTDTFDMEMDTEAAADWAVAFFQNFYTETARPFFYEPMNEPFVHAGSYGSDQVAVRQRMAELYRDIGKAFDEAEVPVNVVGYGSAWPSMELWDFEHWETRMKMFMDVAGEYMDGFSVHLYDGTNITGQDNRRSGSNADAILDLIESYSYIKWGVVKPHAITEYGDIVKGYPEGYDAAKSAQDIRALNHILFGLLERQDRLLTSIPFITSKSPWYYSAENGFQPYGADLWRPDPDKIVDGLVEGFLFTEKLPFYQVWRGVRGERTVALSSNPDVAVRSFLDGAHAYVCLNNYDDVPQTVHLDVRSDDAAFESGHVRRLHVPVRGIGQLTEAAIGAPLSCVTLKPYETVILEYVFDAAPRVREEIHSETHYATTYLQPIHASEPLTFEFKGIPVGAERASLRMSIGRKLDRSKQPLIEVNGVAVEAVDNWAGYDQGNRDDFFGALTIPFPAESLSETTTVQLTFPDDGGHVSSVLLMTDTVR